MPFRSTGMLIVAAALALPGVARADRIAEPDAAEVVRTTSTQSVYPGPARSRRPRGTVMKGARFAVLERARGKGCAGDWLRIADRAWLCSAATRATDEPASQPAALPAGATLPHTYVVTHDAPLYDDLAAAAAGKPSRTLWGTGGYRYGGERSVGGTRYLRADGGWVPASRARVVESIDFHGVELDAGAATRRLAFVGPRPARPVDAAGRRIAGAAPVAAQSWLGEVGAPVTAGRASLVPIGGERFLAAGDVRRLDFAAPPAGVGADEAWIDVDLDQQALIAYRGKRPVYATLVSTAHTTTPLGEFRVEKKRPSARMTSKPEYRHKWDTDAPWVISIRDRIAIHAAYWHTDYGTERSMGCVNVSPIDARWLWQFTAPALPPGWLRIDADADDHPTLVRIRRSGTGVASR